jgi:DNA-binding XRE family transcriptional regulator
MAKGKYEKWITEEGLVLLEGWARDGLTDEQIAHNVGVSRSTLNDWKKKYPDISDALKKGKEVVDLQVENALLKRALGYEYEQPTEENQWNEKAKRYELVVTKRVKKRQAPDTTAQIFWLKNRRPDKWRDKQDVEHTGDMDLNIVIDYGEDND